MSDFKQQLAPSWSPVNIGIAGILFVIGWWPLGLVMIAYVIWGNKVGLNLSRPETFSTFARRVTTAFKAGLDAFTKG